MTYVLVLVVVAVVAYVFREKLAARISQVVSQVRTVVSKPPASNSVQPPIYTDPSVVNPFVKWMLLGYTMPDILRIRQQRGESASLNMAEMAQAREAGYKVDPDPPPAAWTDPNPTDLSDFALHRNPIQTPWIPLTLTFTLTKPQNIVVASCALAGPGFYEVETSISGPLTLNFGRRVVVGSQTSDRIPNAPAGTYTYRIATNRRDGDVRLGSQLVNFQ